MSASRDRFLAAVRDQIGKPYIWGAQDPSVGFDCSGIVCYGLARAGVARPDFDASADGFYRHATAVREVDLQPGDLVFYGIGDRSSHVMIAEERKSSGWVVLGASGGGRKCLTRAVAERLGACVKRLPLRYRRDVLGFGLLVKD